jgi:hypothetical protein
MARSERGRIPKVGCNEQATRPSAPSASRPQGCADIGPGRRCSLGRDHADIDAAFAPWPGPISAATRATPVFQQSPNSLSSISTSAARKERGRGRGRSGRGSRWGIAAFIELRPKSCRSLALGPRCSSVTDPARICSLLAPCPGAKSPTTHSFPIYEMGSSKKMPRGCIRSTAGSGFSRNTQ